MRDTFKGILTPNQLMALASIVQVGEAAYQELMEEHLPVFGHPFLGDIKGRIRTKLVQMQCEIESHDPKFPFEFVQRTFSYKHCIPELRSKNLILHVARSDAPDQLPYAARYKVKLSHNNHPIQRQMMIDLSEKPPYGEAPFYAILTFGGHAETMFSVIQFPEPGYTGIAEVFPLPQLILSSESETTKVFERKKASLKQEFLARSDNIEGGIV